MQSLARTSPPSNAAPGMPGFWRVLVVDDEHEVFQATVIALRNLTPDGLPIEIDYAESGKRAAEKLADRKNAYALVLLDVVMETERAGLDLVPIIRDRLGLTKLQVVLRTGQPGRAPEEHVVRSYEINNYLEKTQVSNLRLRTMVTAHLRAYRALCDLEESREAMAAVARATRAMIGEGSLAQIARGGLKFVLEMIDPGGASAIGGFAVLVTRDEGPVLTATTGAFARGFADLAALRASLLLDEDENERLDAALREPGVWSAGGSVWVSVHRDDGTAAVFHARGSQNLPPLRREVLEVVAGTIDDAAAKAKPGVA